MKVSARGKFVLTVKNVDEDADLAMIEVNGDRPRTYPWPACLTDLMHVEDWSRQCSLSILGLSLSRVEEARFS